MPVDVFESKILVLYKAKYGIGKYWLICLDALVQTYVQWQFIALQMI